MEDEFMVSNRLSLGALYDFIARISHVYSNKNWRAIPVQLQTPDGQLHEIQYATFRQEYTVDQIDGKQRFIIEVK